MGISYKGYFYGECILNIMKNFGVAVGAMAAMTPPYMLPLPVRQHLAKAGWPAKGVRDGWRQSHMGK